MTTMEDQAAGLRERLVPPASGRRNSNRLRCIAVASGKGGVGKTMVSIGLGLGLAGMGFRVLIVDADLGLANVDIQIGADPGLTIQDVVYGDKSLSDVVFHVRENLDLLASSSGAAEMADMGSARRDMFVDELLRFAVSYDYLIIDVAAGVGKSITAFLCAAPEVVVVVANEPTSIMDAYSLIKILSKTEQPPRIHTVINMVRSIQEGEALYHRLDGIIRRFVGMSHPCAGIIPYDSVVGDAIRARTPVMEFAPKSAAGICLREVAGVIAEDRGAKPGEDGLKRLLERFVAAGISPEQGAGS